MLVFPTAVSPMMTILTRQSYFSYSLFLDMFFQIYIFFKIMYELSFEQPHHTRDMRCLDYHNGILATGGSDKLFHMFNVKNGELQKITTSDIFEKNILSLKINRKGGLILVMVGTTDGKIYGFDQHGTPISLFQHNSAISSIDFIDNDHFVTGSWDGKAIVWEISTHKPITEFANHKHAVSVHYNALNSSVISGSQDKALNSWNWKNGQSIKRIESAHNDIIREISAVEEVGFITCSNDQTLKLWTSDLQLIHTFTGHTGFVFSVKATKLGHYFSGGDDKALKVWENQDCIQTIQFPSSIWCIVFDQRLDIFTACSDGFLRAFTLDAERKAPQNVLQAFQKQTLQVASKKSGMSAEDIQKLATIQQMKAMVGKKEGQIRVFKNGNIPEAFMWQNGKWEKIGEVITEGGQQEGNVSAPKYYPGDKYFDAGQYDYIFDVEDDSGTPKTIPFNDGANALEAAEKYCMREGLSKGYIEQIRKFLMQNSSKIPRKALKEQKKEITQENMLATPQCSLIQYNDVKNPAALFKKITEFNSSLEGAHKLADKELEHCERITQLLENSRKYHSVKFDFKQMDTIKKLLTWPKQVKFPVWDLMRAFLAHYQSQTLFNGLDAGIDIIAGLCAALQLQNSEAIYGLMLKTLSNTMIQNTNKNGMLKHGGIVFSSVYNFSKRKQLKNKNLLGAIAGFLFNFSVTIYEKKLENEKILTDYAQILKQRLEIDESQENRNLMLQAIANTTFKYRESAPFFSFAKQYFSKNEVSKDLDLLLG